MQEYTTLFIAQRKFYEREKEFINDLIDLIILRELFNGENHGYSIIKNVKRKFCYNPGTSRVYPSLNNLKKEGYITQKKVEVNGRIRKVYDLTYCGKMFFQNSLRKLESIVEKLKIKNPILKWLERAKFEKRN